MWTSPPVIETFLSASPEVMYTQRCRTRATPTGSRGWPKNTGHEKVTDCPDAPPNVCVPAGQFTSRVIEIEGELPIVPLIVTAERSSIEIATSTKLCERFAPFLV